MQGSQRTKGITSKKQMVWLSRSWVSSFFFNTDYTIAYYNKEINA